MARADLTRQADQLTRMQADYGDVVPRRDFQMLEARYTAFQEKHDVLQSDFNQLKEEHDTMLEVHKQVRMFFCCLIQKGPELYILAYIFEN